MVRLEWKLKTPFKGIPIKFQFLNGAIRMKLNDVIRLLNLEFQFLNGAIRIA